MAPSKSKIQDDVDERESVIREREERVRMKRLQRETMEKIMKE